MGPSLTDDDRAGIDEFTVKTFDSQALSRSITPVLGCANTFFMCHVISLLLLSLLDRNDLDLAEILFMPGLSSVLFTSPELEYNLLG
jgi:hypothetical protein